MPGMLQPKRRLHYHTDTEMTYQIWPINGGLPTTRTLPITMKQWFSWQIGGQPIQDAMPHLSSDDREWLMTGLTQAQLEAFILERD